MAVQPARMIFNGVVIVLSVGLIVGCNQGSSTSAQTKGGDAATNGGVRAPQPLVGSAPPVARPAPPPPKTTTGDVKAGAFGKGNV